MGTRQPIGTAGFLLLVVLFAAFVCEVAGAQTRWPPWQSYGEAESATRANQKRRAIPKQSEIDALNKQVAQLRQAGKHAEAIAAAKRALSLTERRHGPNHAATAAALTTLAELLIEEKRYAEAEPLLKRVVKIREASKDEMQIAEALTKLAQLYVAQGREKEAREYQQRSLVMRQRQLASDPSKAAPPVAAAQPPGGDTKREGGSGVQDAKPRTDAPREQAEAARHEAEQAQARAQAEAERAKTMEEEKRAAEAETRSKAEDREAAKIEEALKARPLTRSLRRAAPKAAAPDADAAVPAAPPPAEPDILARRSGGGGGGTGIQPLPKPAPPMVALPRGTLPTTSPTAPPPAPMAAPPVPSDDTGPAVVAAAPPPEEKWDVVPVFFGTDRAEEANPKRLSYNSDRGRRLELGRALVTVPKAHQVPQVERPWALRIPYFNVTIYEEAEDPDKHFTMQEIKKLSKDDLLRLVRERLGASQRFKDQALVFVHGYNTAFDNAVYRTAQIAYDLKFDGAPFLYSWPSGGAVASYTYDRESAEASKPYMRAFLEMVVKETGAKAVSIIAHSMGNQPLLDVLKDMKSSTPEGVVISQVILAAPDVDADSFSNLAQAINGMAKGVTLYAASNDRALIVSRNFWGHYRAGDVPAEGPLVLPGIDTIDVTAASTDAFAINHSGYAQNNDLLKDIGELIETGKRPPEDRILKPDRVTTDHGAYWRYAAHPPSP